MTLRDGYHPIPHGKIAAIVTHLEMTAPPAHPDTPLPDGMSLRRIARPEPGWYRDLYTRVGAMEWLWFSRLRMPGDALAAILSDPDVEVFALDVDGRAEGLLELDFREAASCELAFLGLTRAAQGRGAGRALVAEAARRAFARDGVRRLRLHTCTLDSPAALPFYLAMGFAAFRREVEVVDDPRLDGTLPPEAAAHVPVIRA